MPDQKENVADINPKEVVPPVEGSVASDAQTNSNNVTQEQRPSSEDHNWKEVRDIMQQQKHKIAELEEKLEKDRKPEKTPIEDPLSNLADDDIVTVGDTKKLVAAYAQREAQKIIDEREKRNNIEQVPNQHSDYNEVIKLADEYVNENPAAKDAILNSQNPRLTAYQMIKSSQLYHKRISSQEVANKTIENSQKPGSSQSVGTSSPLNEVSNYSRMTKDRAAQIRKQAEEYASKR